MLPKGVLILAANNTFFKSLTVKEYAESLFGSTSTLTSSTNPPVMSTWDTPVIFSSKGLIWSSATA